MDIDIFIRNNVASYKGGNVDEIILRSGDIEVWLSSYGCRTTRIIVPDRQNEKSDILLGYDSVEGYFSDVKSMGAKCGRFAGRIYKGFNIDGQFYDLSCNSADSTICYYGGFRRFSDYVWQYETERNNDFVAVRFSRTSTHLEEGFPGNLTVVCEVLLNKVGELYYTFYVKTDAKTYFNLTDKSYYNLNGASSGISIRNHNMKIHSSRFIDVNDKMLPTGGLLDVAGTTYDFTAFKNLGSEMFGHYSPAVKEYGYYDVGFMLDRKAKYKSADFGDLDLALEMYAPNGRTMAVATSLPVLSFYNGIGLDGSQRRHKGGEVYHAFSGFSVETSYVQNNPNLDSQWIEKSIILPGEEKRLVTCIKFDVTH